MSEKKYTAEDFAKAQAATLNRTRGLGGRVDPGDSLPWLILSEDDRRWVRDEDMAAGGWVPVPPPPATPTITESELRETIMGGSGFADAIRDGVTASLSRLGIEVVPDPVPSNAERLAKMLRQAWDRTTPFESPTEQAEGLAVWLDDRGVTAPGGDDDH